MVQVVLREHETLHETADQELAGRRVEGRVYISKANFRNLRRFDEGQAKGEDDLVFDWRRKTAVARQYVGVIQIDNLSVEIIPKIEDHRSDDDEIDEASGDRLAHRNMLYMLSLAGRVPLRPRDVARVAIKKARLIDIFVELFATHLMEELKRGLDREYVDQAENLYFLRGKLQFSGHIRKNLWHKERFFVEYDEYLPDTTMNRIFKYACRRLYRSVTHPRVEQKLQQCLVLLAPIKDQRMTIRDFEAVRFTRQNERFRHVFEFCRLLFQGLSPAPRAGEDESYAVLFDMWTVYEEFVTEFLRRYVLNRQDFGDYRYRPQSRGLTRHLLHAGGEGSRKKLKLQPDILLELSGGAYGRKDGKPLRLVADTKWKRLSLTSHNNVGGIRRDDLYQMYAYTHRFDARCSVLLYPKGDFELPDEDFVLPETQWIPTGEKSVHIRFLDLHRDLSDRVERVALADELRNMLFDVLECKTAK